MNTSQNSALFTFLESLPKSLCLMAAGQLLTAGAGHDAPVRVNQLLALANEA